MFRATYYFIHLLKKKKIYKRVTTKEYLLNLWKKRDSMKIQRIFFFIYKCDDFRQIDLSPIFNTFNFYISTYFTSIILEPYHFIFCIMFEQKGLFLFFRTQYNFMIKTGEYNRKTFIFRHDFNKRRKKNLSQPIIFLLTTQF